MTEINFKDIPIPAYFKWESTYYAKIAKTKVRRIYDSQTQIIRSNPIVTYYGQDLGEFYLKITESVNSI